MAVRGVEQVGERPLEELLQNASQQAVGLAREQLDVLRLELTSRASRGAPGSRWWAEVPFLLRSLREPARRR
jgi:hypothetical protein